MLVREWKRNSVTHKKSVLDLFLGILYGVLGHVNAVDFDARYHLGEVVEQKALAAADVQDLVAGLDTIVIGHRASNLFPAAPDIAIAAVVDPAVSVPILLAPFLGEFGRFGFRKFGIIGPREIVALRALVDGRYEIDLCHFWPDCSVPDELKKMPRVFKLTVRAAGLIPRRIRKPASLDEGGQEVVHHDTAPFQLKHGQQQPRPHRQHIRMGGVRERRGEKAVEAIELYRYGRL